MNIAIRVDSSQDLGTGHFMRCLTLAQNFSQGEDSVIFICRSINDEQKKIIESKKYKLIKLLEINEPNLEWMKSNLLEDAHEVIEYLNLVSIDLLIIDHYGIDYRWEKAVEPYVSKILVIDDEEEKNHKCDFFLNPSYGAEKLKDKFSSNCKENTRFLLGTKYMILRKEFLKYTKSNRKLDFNIKKIHIFFGGVDVHNYTLKYAELLLENFKNIQLFIVVGSNYRYYNQLIFLEKKYIDKVKLYRNIPNMEDVLSQCNMAIGAPGITTWERAALGIPTLYLTTATNQVPILEKLHNAQICCYLGEASQIKNEEFIHSVNNFINNNKKLEIYSKNSHQIIDPESTNRIIKIIRGDA